MCQCPLFLWKKIACARTGFHRFLSYVGHLVSVYIWTCSGISPSSFEIIHNLLQPTCTCSQRLAIVTIGGCLHYMPDVLTTRLGLSTCIQYSDSSCTATTTVLEPFHYIEWRLCWICVSSARYLQLWSYLLPLALLPRDFYRAFSVLTRRPWKNSSRAIRKSSVRA